MSAELVYPAAGKSLAALQDWLRAFQFADILLNPELKRFTFTGKPYDIPDKRRVAKAEIGRGSTPPSTAPSPPWTCRRWQRETGRGSRLRCGARCVWPPRSSPT